MVLLKQEDINGVQTDVLYYLKVRKYYYQKVKIYTKNVNKYDLKFEFNAGDGDRDEEKHVNGVREVVVLKPVFNKTNGFFPFRRCCN